MPQAEPHLSIVIPAFNEQSCIAESLRRVRDWAAEAQPRYEVLVADDGSSDDTAGIVRAAAEGWPALRLVSLPSNRGKGAATREGVLASEGAWVLCSDADLSTPIGEAERLLQAGERAPVVIGSRSIAGANIARRQPLYRVAMGRAFNLATRLATPGGFADTQCGFKLYRADAARDIFSRLTIEGFAFDVEALYLAHRLGYAVAEVPVTWLNDENSSVRVLRDPLEMLADVLRVRRRHRDLSRRP